MSNTPTENSWEERFDREVAFYLEGRPAMYGEPTLAEEQEAKNDVKDFIRREIQQAEQEAYRNGRADEADEHALECKRTEQEAYELGWHIGRFHGMGMEPCRESACPKKKAKRKIEAALNERTD